MELRSGGSARSSVELRELLILLGAAARSAGESMRAYKSGAKLENKNALLPGMTPTSD